MKVKNLAKNKIFNEQRKIELEKIIYLLEIREFYNSWVLIDPKKMILCIRKMNL